MKYFKKSQAITQPFILVLIILVIGLFSTYMVSFGNELASDPNSKINDLSREYIYDQAGFDYGDQTNNTGQLFYTSETDSEGSLKDYALEFNFYQEQSSDFRVFIQRLYNMPSYFIGLFGLPLEDWETFVHIWNTLSWAIVAYAIIRIIRGLL